MTTESANLEFSVLGPLRIVRGGTEVDLNAPMQRTLLLRLLLEPNSILSVDRLQETLWPTAGDDKSRALRFHVSKLRDVIDPDRTDVIATVGDGYELRVDASQIDAYRFVTAVDRAQSAVNAKPAEALVLLEDALALWRGNPYGEVDSIDFAPEVTRLKDTRLRAIETRMEAMLELGRHEEAVEELGVLVSQHPLRERFRGQQMLALYRSGRAAEALRAYESAKRTLGEELGIAPSPALAELEEKILFGEAELLHAPVATPTVNTVPAPSGRLIGRAREILELEGILASSRIVTLIGIGGVGKTRLAQAFALEAQHGHEAVWWIELAAAQTRDEVIDEVIDSIGAMVRTGQSSLEAVVTFLERRRALLVLDNCEHVAGAVAELVSAIRDSAQAVSCLVTSRIPLQLKGESLYRVPRLRTAAGENGDLGEPSEAARFLTELAAMRGKAIAPADEDSVASIARRLEGVPLALELAAARLAVLTPAELDSRLSESLAVLGSAGPEHPDHRQTMSSSIDWSVELLSAAAGLLFGRLGVFAGGASLDAIEHVCVDDALPKEVVLYAVEELASASLLEQAESDGGTRLSMIDAVTEVARARLADSGERDLIRRRHAELFAGMSQRWAEHLSDIDQLEYMARFYREEENLRAALAWSKDQEVEIAVRLAVGLGEYLFRRGRYGEAHRTLEDVVELKGLDETEALAGAVGILAELDVLMGDVSSARKRVDRQLGLADRSGAFTPSIRGRLSESNILWSEGETRSAIDVLSRALDELGSRSYPLAVYLLRHLGRRYLQVGKTDQVPRIVSHLRWWGDQGHPLATAGVAELHGGLAVYVPDYDEAGRQLRAAAESLRAIDARIELAEVLNQAANVALAQLDQDLSTNLALEALELAQESRAKGVESQSRSMIGWALLRSGRPDIARRNLTDAIELALSAPSVLELSWAVSFMAAYQSVIGAPDRAVLLYSAAEQLQASEPPFSIPPNLDDYRRSDMQKLEGELGADQYEQMRAWGRVIDVEELLDLVSA